MSDTKVTFLGPLPKGLGDIDSGGGWRDRLPWGTLLVIVLPTLIAAIYFLFIASPRYVSEAQFVVRTAGQTNTGTLGMALQGIGVSPAQSDAFAVHEFITSRAGAADLSEEFDLPVVLNRGADPFSAYPRLDESRTQEGLHKALKRFVTVGYDSTTGISTLTVEAFRPDDAQAMAETLLAGGEQLINELNERSSANAIAEANAAREVARQRLAEAEAQLTAFRNSEAFVDPEATARIRSQLIGGLLGAAAELRAERAQLQASAPQSPMLAGLDGRIASLEAQIAAEQAKLSGGPGSLAPRVGMFETLRLNRELADRELAQATAAVVTAEQEARRQRLYLDRIVSPHRPDEAIEPRRWLSILTVLATCVLIYGVGWLIWAGVREHRQD